MADRYGRRRGLVLLAALLPACARARAAGTTGAEFLGIPVGGRPAALGGAYSALAEDAYAPVWNPAGLCRLPAAQLGAMHLDYGGALSYEFASFAQPLGAHDGLGAAVQYMRPKASVGRDAAGAETGQVSSYFSAYTISYGHAFTGPLSVGGGLKVVDAELGGISGRTVAGDIGGLCRLGERVSVAAVAANLGGRLRFLDQSQSLGDAYRVSLAYAPARTWTLAAEEALPAADSPASRFGMEWRPVPLVAVRAGYHTDGRADGTGLAGLTTGVGLTALGQRFDYAWAPMGQLGDTQYFSVLLIFGGAKK